MPILDLGIDSRGAVVGERKWSASTKKVSSSAKKATVSVNKMDKSMKRLGRTASTTESMFGGMAAGFIGIAGLTKTVKVIADFGQTMSTVSGVTGATAEQFDRLTESAKEMGATTRFTASQAGESLLFLARAGFTVDEALTALPATLNLAAAGAIDLGSAGDIASNVLAQFSLEAEELTRVVDVMIMTTNSANTNVSQMAEALSLVGPVAGALGYSIEATTAAIGALGNAGIQSSRAGTALRGVIGALLGPTGKAKKALTELGLTTADVSPQTNTLVEIFHKLHEAGMDAAQAFAIFGRRQASGALILSRSVKDMLALEEASNKAAGAAEVMARIMEDNLAGSFRLLKSAAESVALAMGEAGLTSALRGLLGLFTSVFRSISSGVSAFSDLENNVSATKAIITGLTFALGAQGLVGALRLVRTAIIMLQMSNPFTMVFAAIALVVGAVYSYRDALINVGDTQHKLGDVIIASWRTIGQMVSIVLDSLSVAMEELWNTMVQQIDRMFGGMMERFRRVMITFGLGASAILSMLGADLEQTEKDIKRITGILKTGLELPKGLFRQNLADRELEQMLANSTMVFFAGMPFFIPNSYFDEAMRKQLANVKAGKGYDPQAVLDSITMMNGVRDQLKTTDPIIKGTQDAFKNLFESVITGAESATEAIRKLGQEIFLVAMRTAIIDPLGNALGTAVGSGISSIATPLGSAVSGALGLNAPVATSSVAKTTVVNNKTINMNINTKDYDGFRRSRRQIADQTSAYFRG